jgi:hypothetical protein
MVTVPLGGDGYKWVALTNTTFGILMATVKLLDRDHLAARDLPRDRARAAGARQHRLPAVDASTRSPASPAPSSA